MSQWLRYLVMGLYCACFWLGSCFGLGNGFENSGLGNSGPGSSGLGNLGLTSFSVALAADAIEIDQATQLWKESAHALQDINCSSCHQDQDSKVFVARPNQTSCQSCHDEEVNTFLLGKHGIRLLEGQSPLTPAMARLPMKSESLDKQMTCNTCHDVHSVKTVTAARDSCLSCHNDQHSLNYENSKHAQLFEKDLTLPRPSGNSVSCASCHLPRHELKSGDDSVTIVNHNNTYTLLPRDRMVQEVCMNCHGVEYSFNSIFDDDLVEANFDKPPTLSLETLDLVRQLEARRKQ